MSKEAMMFVLDRAAKEPGFNAQMVADPDGTLSAYDLTPEEIEALKDGRPHKLRAVGLDPRIASWLPWRRHKEKIAEFAKAPYTSKRPYQAP